MVNAQQPLTVVPRCSSVEIRQEEQAVPPNWRLTRFRGQRAACGTTEVLGETRINVLPGLDRRWEGTTVPKGFVTDVPSLLNLVRMWTVGLCSAGALASLGVSQVASQSPGATPLRYLAINAGTAPQQDGCWLATYTLVAKADDDAGITAESDPVRITVTPNQPPTVRVVRPHNGAVLPVGADIDFQAMASVNIAKRRLRNR